MRFKKFRGFLCLFHVVLCAMVLNQQSFAGTWADAFEEWKPTRYYMGKTQASINSKSIPPFPMPTVAA